MLVALALLLLPAQAAPSDSSQRILGRIAEEAEMLRQNAHKALSEEKLEQRAIRPPSRFRPGPGQTAAAAPKPQFHTREIVSEYSVGSLREGGSDNPMEFRQVISVDGKPVQSAERAVHALSKGLAANEDRQRRRMLEEYEHHGLVGAVSDFGILLVMFTRRGMQDLDITPLGRTQIGADEAALFKYVQKSGDAGILNISGRKTTRYPLQGILYARASDGLPLRITCEMRRVEAGHHFYDVATIDYTQTRHGFVAPASVVHRGFTDDQLQIENRFTYSPFKEFGAEVDVKFDVAPESEAPAAKPAEKKP